MALTVDGIPVSGSIGKITYSRNRAGAYQRRRTKPVNPNSSPQVIARGFFRAAIDEWTNGLTPSQRLGWKTYAEAVPWLNKAGESIRLSGQQAYLRVACFLQQSGGGLATAATAPGIFDIGSIQFNPTGAFVRWDISDSDWDVSLDFPVATNTWQVEDGILLLRMVQPANPSVNFRPNRAQRVRLYTSPGPAVTPIVFDDTDPFPFTLTPLTEQKVWFWARGMSPDNRLTEEILVGPILTTSQA